MSDMTLDELRKKGGFKPMHNEGGYAWFGGKTHFALADHVSPGDVEDFEDLDFLVIGYAKNNEETNMNTNQMSLGEALKRVLDHADSSIFEWNEQTVLTRDADTLSALAMDIHFMQEAVRVIRSHNIEHLVHEGK